MPQTCSLSDAIKVIFDRGYSETYPILIMAYSSHPLGSSAGLTSLSELVDRCGGLLCDIWGVIHNGGAASNDAVDALCRTRTSGRFVILITNAPRLFKDIYPQLARFGVPRKAFDTIITLSDVTAQLVANQPDVPLFHFGPARDQSILEGLTNQIVGISDAKLCLLTGPLNDTIETAEIYHNPLKVMRDNAVEMICANPDLVVRSGKRMVICAGSIAQYYTQLGDKVTFAGKLEPAIYDEALKKSGYSGCSRCPKRQITGHR